MWRNTYSYGSIAKVLASTTIAAMINAPAVMAIALQTKPTNSFPLPTTQSPTTQSPITQSPTTQSPITQLPTTAALIYVNPKSGKKGIADGSPDNPYKSISVAIAANPAAGTVIQLAEGTYSTDTGETFPIKLPAGITLRGEPNLRGANTIIRGSGKYISPSFASQNVTLITSNDTRIEGITVTNPETRGTAVWVESSKRVAIANNNFINSNREGLFLTGDAQVNVTDNLFKNNGANGLSAVGSSSGEIRNNFFEDTGFGLAVGQRSRVLVVNNNILKNNDGVVISNLASPTFRNNLITDNKRNGIVILMDRSGYPTPDLGTTVNLGQNVFRNNGEKDLNNNSGVEQVAVGNELSPQKIAGKISFTGMTPTPAAAPITTPIVTPRSPSLPPAPPSVSIRPNEDIIIDRDPVPITPPPIPNLPSSAFIPSTPAPVTTIPATPAANPAPVTIPIIRTQPTPNNAIAANPNPVNIPINVPNVPNVPINNTANINPPVPYNPTIAALVPPNTNEQFPYLVVIPSADAQVLNKVQSAVPSAKVIPSRFGNIIFVRGYPDRDRAEVLRAIMKSAIGLDARVIHQNGL
jgi:parallel beta-helix repeat protein